MGSSLNPQQHLRDDSAPASRFSKGKMFSLMLERNIIYSVITRIIIHKMDSYMTVKLL